MMWHLAMPLVIVAMVATGEARAQQNVLIVMADDLGVDMVGAYGEGSDLPPTPTIDALAATGVLFRNAWANPVCSPSRAAVLTGRYAFRNTVGAVLGLGNLGLPASELTIPEALDRDPSLGYSHAFIGKWHLGDWSNGGPFAPNEAGFQHYAGSYSGIAPTQQAYFDWDKITDGVLSKSTTYNTTETANDAVAWISTASEPWFCFVSFCAPHTSLHAPPAELHTINLPADPPDVEPRPYYKAMVEALDTEIGRMFFELGERLDNTTIVFLGDNGTSHKVTVPPFHSEHAKGTTFEGGVNVPIIITGRAVVEPGAECTALVSVTDLFATVADLAGLDLEATLPDTLTLDSVTLVDYLAFPAMPGLRSTVFTEKFSPNGTSPHVTDRALRNEHYKLKRITSPKGTFYGLYDLQADPFEKVDLLRKYQNPMPQFVGNVFQELRGEMDALLASP